MLPLVSPLSPSLLPIRYASRGWCNFERALAQLIKPSDFCIDIGRFTVDTACEEYIIGKEDDDYVGNPLRIGEAPFAERTVAQLGEQGSYYGSDLQNALGKLVSGSRRAPLSPAAFANVLSTTCTFTNGADSAVVVELYRSTSTALLGSTTEIYFNRLKWQAADYQQLGEALPYCGTLEKLTLFQMQFDAAGSAAVQTWVLPPSLKALNLFNCHTLASLPSLPPSLKSLDLFQCLSLTSMPDASWLTAPDAKVILPYNLEPWKAGGFKAWDCTA